MGDPVGRERGRDAVPVRNRPETAQRKLREAEEAVGEDEGIAGSSFCGMLAG